MLALGHSDEGELHYALSAAKVFRDNSKAFVNLSLYEQRLSRQQKDALRQLHELQAERKAAQPLASVPAPEMRLPAASAAATSASEQPAEFVYSNGRACALDGQALSRQMPDQGSEAVVGEYDPGAFDPIFFKRSVPVRFIEKEAA
jgi:hypothetical protein